MEARFNVNPTRMEQQKQKARLKTAVRGHKLLKDKSNEMLRHFMVLIKENRALRNEVEDELSKTLHLFLISQANMTEPEIDAVVSESSQKMQFSTDITSIMGLRVPKITVDKSTAAAEEKVYITTSGDFDESLRMLHRLQHKILELASMEKTCDLLAAEIVKNRRRINSLEHIMIPKTHETIKYIAMKLAENERGNQIRLMKVKEIINAENNPQN